MDTSDTQEAALDSKLKALSNDFTEFNGYCSFFCDAMAALLNEYKDSEPDPDTLMGARQHFFRLKYKTEELKIELDEVYRLSKNS